MKKVVLVTLCLSLLIVGCSKQSDKLINSNQNEKKENTQQKPKERPQENKKPIATPKQGKGYKIKSWDGSRFFIIIDPQYGQNIPYFKKVIQDVYKNNKDILNLDKIKWNISFFTIEKYAGYKTELVETNYSSKVYVAEYWRKGQDTMGDNILVLNYLDQKQVYGPKIFR